MHIEQNRTGAVELLGLRFDQIDIDDLVGKLRSVSSDTSFGYVVTPNVDHMVRLGHLKDDDQRGAEIYQAYRGATYCVCDSRVLARLAGPFGVRLTVVPGSDLTARLFESVVEGGDRIAIIGGDQWTLATLQRLHPSVEFKQHIPPMGLLENDAALAEAATFAACTAARFTLLAIGSPQQELLASRMAKLPQARGVALCIGAAVDFISGRQKRAPLLVQKLSMEWSYRLLQEPRRLWRRYLLDGPKILAMLVHWRRQQRNSDLQDGRSADP
jgi:exopolysaccharide biosynthesis WecB/TagA/CpsF family protein